ncbi:hypothetical protein ABH935_004152 [Catenulispora sp. GAS73]|uniref:hypothetical protein n=1 Tax=Catenulispora sp. GAS73 TaxID=3156269 RepID=UPI0035159B13
MSATNAAFSGHGRTLFVSRGTAIMSVPTDGSAAEELAPGVGALVATGTNGLAGSSAMAGAADAAFGAGGWNIVNSTGDPIGRVFAHAWF